MNIKMMNVPEINLKKIDAEIVSRLVYYKGYDDNHIKIKGFEQTMNIVRKKRIPKNKNLNSENGWLRKEQIEQIKKKESKQQAPYIDIKKGRQRHLNERLLNKYELIERKEEYYIERSRELGDRTYVYKLKTRFWEFAQIFLWFYKKDIYYFMESDYYKDNPFIKKSYKFIREEIDKGDIESITLPPTLIKHMIERKNWFFSKSFYDMILEFDFVDFIESYLIVDFVQCDNEVYRKKFRDTYELIGDGKLEALFKK
ncbi:MAG: hypothetical protein ABH828_00525 [archaeon]